MRSCYFILLLLLMSVTGVAQTTLLDFEGAAPTLNDFNGSATTIIDNPDVTAPNTSAKVAQNVVPAGASFAGVNIPQAIDFANGKTFKMQVWSPMANTPVLLKFEGGTDPAVIERVGAFTGPANSWQEVAFSFADQGDLSFASVSVFMNFNVVGGEELTFYWDNLVQDNSVVVIPGPTTAAPTPTHDAADVISIFSDAYTDVPVDTYAAEFTVGDFTDTLIEGNATLLYSNLAFAGIETIGDNAIDLVAAGMTHLHVHFWSANSTTFGTKLVDFGGDGFGNGNDTEFEIQRNLGQAQWVSVEYPLAGFTGMNQDDINQIIISSAPFGTSNVYLDNIYFFSGEALGTQMDLPVTFDEEGVDYGLTDFGGNSSMIVADPEDAGNTVAQSIKTAGAMTWAGTTLTSEEGGPAGFASRIPFAADATKMSVRVWSPTAGTPVRLKVEKADDPTISVEAEVNTLVAGAWDTLVFDFSMEATGTAAINFGSVYDKASIFFNFGTQPAEDATYYWDDILFGGDGGGNGGGDDAQMDLPVTFDEEDVDYGLVGFGNSNGAIVADPTDATNMVGEVIKSAGAEVWAGVTMTSNSGGPDGFASSIPFAADATTITLRTWSPAAGVNILLKAEKTDDGTVSVETNAVTTAAGEWETITFDFANEAAGTPALDLNAVYGKLSIFFDFGNQPAADATYYFDDVYFGDVVSTNEPVIGLLAAFPNPIGNEFSIVAPERMESLVLFSSNGQKLGEWQPNTERFDLEAGHLAPGMYVALARTASGLMTIKLLKQ